MDTIFFIKDNFSFLQKKNHSIVAQNILLYSFIVEMLQFKSTFCMCKIGLKL